MLWKGAAACSSEQGRPAQGALRDDDSRPWLGPTQDRACRWVCGKLKWLVELHWGAGSWELR